MLTIEAEIVPRLMLAHRTEYPLAERDPERTLEPTADDIAELARLLVAHEASMGCSYFEALQSRGLSLEKAFLHLFAPAARLLGELWAEDRCTFAEVTIGLARLQQLVREVSPVYAGAGGYDLGHAVQRVLLAAVPGEQHVFGLQLLEAFYRRAGYEVMAFSRTSEAEIVDILRNEFIAMVGFSSSNSERLDAVARLVEKARRVSMNPGLVVMVGGTMFSEHPEFVGLVGACGSARDAREAVLFMERHLGGASKPRVT